jgi:hypothetical protein
MGDQNDADHVIFPERVKLVRNAAAAARILATADGSVALILMSGGNVAEET